jgi:hypothetical protein
MPVRAVLNQEAEVTMPTRPRFLALTVMAALILLSCAGAAVAYWAGAGAGTGAAGVGTLRPVILVGLAGESPSSTLVPGGPAADVVVKIDNQNAFDVTLVAVTSNGPVTAGNGCAPTGVTLATPTNLPLTLPPGISVTHLAGAAAMGPTSASACQGATFAIPVTLAVRR